MRYGLGRATVCTCLALALTSAISSAQSLSPSPTAAELCAPGTTIGSILVERVNVFDLEEKGENKRIFRVVNTVHRPMLTRDFTVRALLTLREGDACSLESLHEAERSLRAIRIFQDAWIEPIERQADRVTIRVRVRDAWSTKVRASFSSQGGANRSVFAVNEKNLFGTGYSLSWEKRSDQDRDERNLEFTMPQMFGSKWQLYLLDGKNSDGQDRIIQIQYPFYKLDSRHSFFFQGEKQSLEQKVYVGPKVVDTWTSDLQTAQASFGWSPRGLENGKVRRYYASMNWNKTSWSPTDLPIQRPDLAPRNVDRSQAGFQYVWTRPDFRRVAFYDTARRIQDFDMSDRVSFGVSVPIPDFTQQQAYGGQVLWQRGVDLGNRNLAVFTSQYTFQRLDGDWLNRVFDSRAEVWFKRTDLRTLYMQGRAAFGQDLEGQNRFLLGGDTGLRGYRSRAFTGSNLLLLDIEYRFFAPWEIAHLFRVGLVGFGEVGAIWEDEQPLSWARAHPDIGIGARFELLRSSHGTTVQVNVAYPLDPNGDPEEGQKLQFSVLTTQGF
ncbi:MAG: hypothetical protein U0V87_07595 [Acidobacteriota bacterium]